MGSFDFCRGVKSQPIEMETTSSTSHKHSQFIQRLTALHYNTKCADCGREKPAWAAVTFGFFVCYECAAQHRRLGQEKSRIKNITMDTWSVEELRRMHVGGNRYSYKFKDTSDIMSKYQSPVADERAEELNRLCAESAQKEPGDSFMDAEERKPVGFGRAVIKKKSMPKFSDKVDVPIFPGGMEEAKPVMPAEPQSQQSCEAKTEVTAKHEPILSRSKSTSVNLKSTLDVSRSPFSFHPSSSDESEDSS